MTYVLIFSSVVGLMGFPEAPTVSDLLGFHSCRKDCLIRRAFFFFYFLGAPPPNPPPSPVAADLAQFTRKTEVDESANHQLVSLAYLPTKVT